MNLGGAANDRHSLTFGLLRAASAAESREELFEQITGLLAEGLEADLTGIFEYLPDSRAAVVKAGVGWDRSSLSVIRVDAAPGSAVARVLSADQPVIVSGDREAGLDPPPLLGGQNCAGGCAMRIGDSGRPYGYVAAFSLTEREFTLADAAVVAAAAEAVSLALARLRVERRFSAQRGVIDLVASARRLGDASAELLQLICSGIGWDVATLWLVDPADQVLRCVDTWRTEGITDEFIELTHQITHAPGEGIPGEVWETGEPAWFTDLPRETGFKRADAARRTGLYSALLFPITARGRVAGIFEVFTRQVEQPDEELLAELAGFGAQIGQLLERELVQAELARSSEEMAIVLNNLATAVSAINPDGSIRFANDAAARSIGFEAAAELLSADLSALRKRFRVFDDDGTELKGEDVNPIRRALRGEGVGPRLVRLLDTDDGSERWYQLRTVPIQNTAGDVAWALAAVDDVTKLKRNEERLRRSEAVHRRIGEVLQRGLLPPALPEIPSVNLAVRFRALGDGTLVGGDFYDAFSVPGDRWMIVVGDITGKGVEAAAFTALVRYTIRAVAVRDRDPAATLAQLNQILIEDPSQSRLCTAICASIDPGKPNRISLARGGHPPALRLGAGEQETQRIEPLGPVLGAFDDAAFESQTFDLGPSDMLVLYTDGVSDAGVRTPGGPLEIEGVEGHLAEARERGAEGIASAIDGAAAAADGGRQHDDALVVVIEGR